MVSGESYRTVQCERHGNNREAFMCKHLLGGVGLGFFCDTEDVSNPYPDAWCSECQGVLGESSEFEDDYARLTFKLVCGGCYEEIKAKHIVASESTARIQ
jgi:hypothetical protein